MGHLAGTVERRGGGAGGIEHVLRRWRRQWRCASISTRALSGAHHVETIKYLETGAGALLFAAVFLMDGRLHPLQALVRDRRSIVSFSAGMATAYVFVHVMPELSGVRRSFVTSMTAPLPYEGMGIYFIALLGFLVFYGLDHLRSRLRNGTNAERSGLAFKLHIGGFSAYVWLMAYLLVDNLEETSMSTALYTVAIALHFLAVDHALHNEHGTAYERIGRFVLAGMSVLGWGAGLLFALPDYVLALLVAFVSGAIVMNSAIMELPSEKDGRAIPFMIGGIAYGLVLLPLG